ncbi:MAG: hypothetical protein GX801_04115 [Fibrobacter sp.]|nr:hypothetical protein [Fibrobacter sp.]
MWKNKLIRNGLVLILFFFAFGQAAELNGIGGVHFGSTKEDVIEEIFKRGLHHQEQPRTNQIILPKYSLGDLPVEIVFRFNRNNKFFSYEIRTGKVERDRYSKVLEAVVYMTEQFEGVYGRDNKNFNPQFKELQEKRYVQYSLWNHNQYDVLTLIRTVDARYFIQGIVTNKHLAKEAY